MAPKLVGRMAKTAAKAKQVKPNKTIEKTKTKTPEKKEAVELEESQKTLQMKMEVHVETPTPVVKLEPGEGVVTKGDQSCFVSSAKKSKNEDLQKAYEHYQSLNRYDKQKQDRHLIHQDYFFKNDFGIEGET